MNYYEESYSYAGKKGLRTLAVLHTEKDCKRIKGSLTGPLTPEGVMLLPETLGRVLCQSCGLDPEFLRRKRQIRDALNKCRDPGLIEEIGHLLKV